MWTVYYRPRDWQDAKYVVRVWYGERMTEEVAPFDDLTAARAAIALAGGCARLERSPEDDPAILEVWI
jgi:hypothetical protein